MSRKKPAEIAPTTGEHPAISLEMMLTHPEAFGLTTATPIQRAICRVADGEPLGELANDPDVLAAFGGTLPPAERPLEFVSLMAIRGAKSMTAAAAAICATQNVDVSKCGPGDLIRVGVLSTDVDKAKVVFQHICGPLLSRPLLAQLVVAGPTADSITLRHPTGAHIEIKVTAMARAGSTLVGMWLAGCIFDEAPRMAGEGSARSLEESRNAITGRMLPGAQIWYVGSPHAPFGTVYNMQHEHWGKPTADIVVVRARGDKLNPTHWTPQAQADLERRSPRAYRTDFLAEFADPEESLISSVELEECTRAEPLELPPAPRIEYAAFIDPATRANSWTLLVVGCYGLGGPSRQMPLYKVALAKQWTGTSSEPLSPARVLAEVRRVLEPYRVTTVCSDQWSLDALRDLAEYAGLLMFGLPITSENRVRMAEAVAFMIRNRTLEVPADRHLRADLISAEKRTTQNGITLVMPQSSDGRHCDYLPPLMLMTVMPPDLPAGIQVATQHGEFQAAIDEIDLREGMTRWERHGRRLWGV